MADALETQTRASLLFAVRDPQNGPAWVAFTECYGLIIRGWCREMGLQDADTDDVTQEVLAKLVEKMKTFVYDPSKSFRGWLHAVVRNEVKDVWRAQDRRPGDWGSGDSQTCGTLERVPVPGVVGVEAMVQDLVDQMERDRLVHVACEKVRQKVAECTWQAFRMTTVEGCKGAEVALLLGKTVAAVHMAKSRVLTMIRAEIASLAEGDATIGP